MGFLLGLVLGMNVAFFVCHEWDLNWFNDGNDTHVTASTSDTVETITTVPITPPSVSISAIAGTQLDSAQREVLYRSRGSILRPEINPHVRLKAAAGNMSDMPGMLDAVQSIDVDPCPDMSYATDTIVEVPFTQTAVLSDTIVSHTQMVRYHFRWLSDCLLQRTINFNFTSSTIEALVVERTVTNTVIKRPWLRVAPFVGTNALNTSEWTGGIKIGIRFGDFWAFGGGELPMRKDPKLSVPLLMEYTLFEL